MITGHNTIPLPESQPPVGQHKGALGEEVGEDQHDEAKHPTTSIEKLHPQRRLHCAFRSSLFLVLLGLEIRLEEDKLVLVIAQAQSLAAVK